MKKEELLKQENGEALVLAQDIKRLEKRRDKLSIEITEKTIHLQEICQHIDTEIVSDYHEGGYYNRCKYIKRLMCKTCGKQLKETITYGGFN